MAKNHFCRYFGFWCLAVEIGLQNITVQYNAESEVML
jgi:hypothetical protein